MQKLGLDWDISSKRFYSTSKYIYRYNTISKYMERANFDELPFPTVGGAAIVKSVKENNQFVDRYGYMGAIYFGFPITQSAFISQYQQITVDILNDGSIECTVNAPQDIIDCQDTINKIIREQYSSYYLGTLGSTWSEGTNVLNIDIAINAKFDQTIEIRPTVTISPLESSPVDGDSDEDYGNEFYDGWQDINLDGLYNDVSTSCYITDCKGELNFGTDPMEVDTDEDLIEDYDEVKTNYERDPNQPPRYTNPLLPDTDGEGLEDGFEVTGWTVRRIHCVPSDCGQLLREILQRIKNQISYENLTDSYQKTSDPTIRDTDNDQFDDYQEYLARSDPRKSDTDDDRQIDGFDDEPTVVDWSPPYVNNVSIYTIDHDPWKTVYISFNVHDDNGIAQVITTLKCGFATKSCRRNGEGETNLALGPFTMECPIVAWDIQVTVETQDTLGNYGVTVILNIPSGIEWLIAQLGKFIASASDPETAGAIAGAVQAFIDSVGDILLIGVTMYKMFTGARDIANAIAKDGFDVIMNAYESIKAGLNDTQKIANPYAEGCEISGDISICSKEARFRNFWWGGYIVTTLALSVVGVGIARSLLLPVRAALKGIAKATYSLLAKYPRVSYLIKGISEAKYAIALSIGSLVGGIGISSVLNPEFFMDMFYNGLGLAAILFYAATIITPGGYDEKFAAKLSTVMRVMGEEMVKDAEARLGKSAFKEFIEDFAEKINNIERKYGKKLINYGEKTAIEGRLLNDFLKGLGFDDATRAGVYRGIKENVIDIEKVKPTKLAQAIESARSKWNIDLIDETLQLSTQRWSAQGKWGLARTIDEFGINDINVQRIERLKDVNGIDKTVKRFADQHFRRGVAAELEVADMIGAQNIKEMSHKFPGGEIDILKLDGTIVEVKTGNPRTIKKDLKTQIPRFQRYIPGAQIDVYVPKDLTAKVQNWVVKNFPNINIRVYPLP